MRELDIEDLGRRYLSGESMEALAKSVGFTGNGLRHRLAKAGFEIQDRKSGPGEFRKRVGVDVADILKRYAAGDSEQAISLALKVGRPTVRHRLIEAGVQIRGLSDALNIRMARLGPEGRAKLASAAHAAICGVPQKEETPCKAAITRERQGVIGSENERAIGGWLQGQGIEVTHQKAVGKYNVDVALTESRIAVEIFGGHWHSSTRHAPRYRPRIEYLFDRDWHSVIVWVDGTHPLVYEVADQIIALHEARCSGKSLGRQEHVIRGDGYMASVAQVKPHDGAIVLGFNPGNSHRGEDGRFR